MQNLSAPKYTFHGHEMAVTSFCVAEESKKLCSGSRDQSVALWDVTTGQRIAEKGIPRNTVTCIELIPGPENTFVQCSEDLSIRIWDIRELKPVLMVPLNDNYFAYSCSVNKTGTKLLTGHYASNEIGCGVTLWDLRKFSEDEYLWRFLEHKETVVKVEIMSREDKELAISASKDARIKAIKMSDGTEVQEYQDESKWPFTTFDIISKNDLLIAGLRMDSDSRLLALKIGDDSQFTVAGGANDEQIAIK
jgi:WD40 repeat protein